ncbi:MAG: LEVG family PEP-CTERM protein [Coleofasciculaceae cyanobacterium]
MNKQFVFSSSSKLGFVASLLASSSLCVGFLAPSASAVSINLVPQSEGEVNVGLGTSLDSKGYLNLNPIIQSVESLVDSSTGTKSRLFVDQASTANQYGTVNFLAFDIGTADKNQQYWFRPLAMDYDSSGNLIEKGQLEVGTFKFTFSQVIESLTVRWFDTEYFNKKTKEGTTYTVNSTDTGYVPVGKNNNVFEKTFYGVSDIVLDLGQRKGKTGDGVNFQAEATTTSVPEPGVTVGLAALAATGVMGLRKRRKTSAEN